MNESKANLNKCVFSCFLKASTETAERKAIGSAFHRFGATASKERSPLVFKRVRGTTSNPWLEDLRGLFVVYEWSRSEIYTGA